MPDQHKGEIEIGGDKKLDGTKETAGEFETSGPGLKTDKTELAKIIERNRQQVEEEDDELEEVMQEKRDLAKDFIEEANVPEKPRLPERPVETERKIMEQFDQEKVKKVTPVKKQDEEEHEHIKSHAQRVYGIVDPEEQIEQIVQLALTKDPFFAVKVAKHLDDNYIMNEVHDRLVEEQVREQLIKKGLLPEL